MINLHTHTYRCKHAQGDVIDYAMEGCKRGLTVLGVSDHCPFPDGRWSHVRMSMEELEEYERAVEYARAEVPELTLVKGLECEWLPEYKTYMEDTFLSGGRFDYLIGAVHWIPFNGEWIGYKNLTHQHLRAYTDYLIEGMESGLFAFIAHPDIFGSGYAEWDANTVSCSRDILQAVEELGIPLEINGNGMKKAQISTHSGGSRYPYPWLPFWELGSEYDIEVVCNSDAHTPAAVVDFIEECSTIARRFKLREHPFSFDEFRLSHRSRDTHR